MKAKKRQSAFTGSPLNREMILKHLDLGNIRIAPFVIGNLGIVSYDVRLGQYFFRGMTFGISSNRPLNPFDSSDIKGYWGNAQEGEVAEDWMRKNGPLANIKPDDRIIVLEPGEMILAHTEEFIGGRNCITTKMSARSSVGRIGVTSCNCANFGDPGFSNRWSLEMSNRLKMPIILVMGMRVAQIHFYLINASSSTYTENGGQYQGTDDFECLIENWSPNLILPRFSREKY